VKWLSDPCAYSPGESFAESCSLVHLSLVIGIIDFMSILLLVTLGREVGKLKYC
jgi:hypothetical protein